MRLSVTAGVLFILATDALGTPIPGPRPTTKTPGPVGPLRTFSEADQERAVARRLSFAWAVHPEQPVAQRRVAVFTIWNTADGEPYPAAARKQVEDYIHLYLAGGNKFTDEEITRFNQQRGRPPFFDPYGVWEANHVSP
jgi:hypothetical protein